MSEKLHSYPKIYAIGSITGEWMPKRIGKVTGTVRVKGADMEKLRKKVYVRSGGHCEMRVHLIAGMNKDVNTGRLDYLHAMEMMKQVLTHCRGKITLQTMHLAHIKSKGSGGADVESNTLASCDACHGLSHNSNGKPCPKKPLRGEQRR